jgi:hypothetical protein
MRAGIAFRSGSRGVLAVIAAGLGFITVACGEAGFDASHLQAQGAAGERALQLIDLHGGMARFLALEDLEYRVSVERFDAAGVLAGSYEEVHRFPVSQPRRYALRRTSGQILELGLDAEQRTWSRQDGIPREGATVEASVIQNLWVRSVLSRAPFCLADEDVTLSMARDEEALMATWPAGAHGEERTAIFFTDPASGGLSHVILQDPDMIMGAVMQSATASSTTNHDGVSLVDRWTLASTQLVDGVPGLPQLSWKVDQLRSTNGFTDRLYNAENP